MMDCAMVEILAFQLAEGGRQTDYDVFRMISAAVEGENVNSQKDADERWSRDPDLNRRPVDCSIYIMLLVLNIFSLT